MIRNVALLGFAGLVLVGAPGCRHMAQKRAARGLPPIGRDSMQPRTGPNVFIEPPGLPPTQVGPLIPMPSGNFDTFPPPSTSERNTFLPPSSSSAKPGTQLLLPDPLPPGTPQSSGSGSSKLLDDPAEPRTSSAAPPVNRTNALTTGVSSLATLDYQQVTEQLASGRKPSIEQLPALSARGVKTLVHLHAPGADTRPYEEAVNSRGLRYVGVPMSAETLKTAYPKFAEAIRNTTAYVADEDGSRTGPSWYIYFRTVGGYGDDLARIRAAALGLRDTPDAEANKYWTAIRDLLK
ncbi:MAG: hypothetical protein ACRCZF_22210 [Gemmataceae bacterium]